MGISGCCAPGSATFSAFRSSDVKRLSMPAPIPTSTDETELRSPTDPAASSGPEGGSAHIPPPVDDRTSAASPAPVDADAPLSFVPHIPLRETVRPQPLRIQTGRYGELQEHELIQLLDSIEDERARSRFRESIYISVFVWMAIALLLLFGPKYLWHAPKLVLPSEVLRQRELTTLTAPDLNALRPRQAPPVDSRTLEHLRSTEPKIAPRPAPQPAPQPVTPRAELPRQPRPEPPSPSPLKIAPATAPPNIPLPSAPAPQPVPRRPPPPVVADAPTPQPSSRPNFNTPAQSAGDMVDKAVRSARPGGGTPGGIRSSSRGGSEVGMGPAEILSDTEGVNFNPYLQRILREIYDVWIPLIPEEARPPLMKSGVTMIRFKILPDGTIGGIYLDGSTHDDALNRAAWGSITGVGQFPPLPSQFHGPNLELRIHYLVNQKTE